METWIPRYIPTRATQALYATCVENRGARWRNEKPYRGGAPAINDLIAGHIKLGSLGSTPLLPHYKSGALLLLAQSTLARSPSLPEVPTYQEAGMQGLVLDQWLGVFVPAGTAAASASA